MMKSVKFGNKNALEIIDTDFKKNIKEIIWERAKVRPLDKNYRILNHELLEHLKKCPHLVTLSTYGKKFLLCLIRINDKNHTIFIDRKGEMMVYIPLGFDETLYKGTIFDGELIKDNDGQWHYFIMDILLSDGKPTYLMQMKDKIELVQNMIAKKYTAKEMDFCQFEMKEYFPYQYLDDLCSTYAAKLNYKCSGLIFKNQFKNEKGLLYIFPENRTNSESTNTVIPAHVANKITSSSSSTSANSNFKSNVNSNFKSNVNSNVKSNVNSNANTSTSSSVGNEDEEDEEEEEIEENKSYDNENFIAVNRVFLMKNTELPDVYELYGKNKKNDFIKVSLASVTSMDVSKKINKMFQGGVKEVVVECKYIKRFKKWEPIGCVSKEVSKVE